MSARSPLLNVITAAVLKAAKGMVRDFGEVGNLQVSKKGTANYVTATDLRAEKILHAELKKARPDFGFLMEEGGEVPGKDGKHRWIIDPLDGTTNFIHAVPYFCISVALEKKISDKRSEIIAGVVYDPIHNDMFVAEKHGGAYLNDRRLHVSTRREIEDALLVTCAPRLGRKGYVESLEMLTRVTETAAGTRFFGAAALDLAYVAAGRYDGFWHNSLNSWDMAAGMLLIQEAGGMVSQIDGEEVDLAENNVLASNKHLHRKMISLLKDVSAGIPQ